MALQELIGNLDKQIQEHNDAKGRLEQATTALEDIKKQLQQRQDEIGTDEAVEKAELNDVKRALQDIRDEADRQLAALTGTTDQGTATTTQGTATTTAPAPPPQGGQGGAAAGQMNRLDKE
jgi:peptidoglycan hydrolase CwlO-like protein